MLDGFQDGRLRDFMKHDSLRLLHIQSQHLSQVPRDGLSLAVFIGCEPDSVRLAGSRFQRLHERSLLFGYLILWSEIVEVHAEFIFLEVTDMSIT